jgi:hypothetical protein
MAIKDRINALHRILRVMAMAMADSDPKFRENFVEGLEEFSRQSNERGQYLGCRNKSVGPALCCRVKRPAQAIKAGSAAAERSGTRHCAGVLVSHSC